MKKYQERFSIVRCVGGYRTVPCNPLKSDLLLRLHAGVPADVDRLLRMPLADLIDNIREAAASRRMAVEVCGDPKAPTIILSDLAAKEKREAVPLYAQLKKLGIPLRAVWLPDGKIKFPNSQPGMYETEFAWDPSLSRSDNKNAAAAHVASLFPHPETTYFSLRDFLDKQGYETPYQYGRALYKYTDCGPWVSFQAPGKGDGYVYYEDPEAVQTAKKQDWWDACTGIEIGSIVEGSDVTVGPEYLAWPFTEAELDKTVNAIDEEAAFYWERDNSTYYSVHDKDGNALFYCQWEQFDDKPEGSFDEGELDLAIKAGETLFEVGSPDYETLIPIPGTEFFVREEPIPDIIY